MPIYDVSERHRILVAADRETVFRAIREADLASGTLTRVLLAVRGIRARARRLAAFERAGFRIVAERPPEEILIGLVGKFWTPRGGLCAGVSAASFAAGPPAGHALAGWNFRVAAGPQSTTELTTETRVRCAPDARAKF